MHCLGRNATTAMQQKMTGWNYSNSQNAIVSANDCLATRRLTAEMRMTRQSIFLLLLAGALTLCLVQLAVVDLTQPIALWRRVTFVRRTSQIPNGKRGKVHHGLLIYCTSI